MGGAGGCLGWIPFGLDIPNALGHLNIEIFPDWWTRTPLYYLFYTPSYHHVHHRYFSYNYALFM